jgi:DHA2 family multidrug resistance protein
MVLAWAGLPQLLIIPFVPALLKRFDPRAIVCVGLVIFGVSCLLNIHLSFNDGGQQFMFTNIVRALGQAVVLSPLSVIALSQIAPSDSAAASGLFNMLRSLGGAIGTSLLATIITKREQYHSNIIGLSVTPSRPADESFLLQLQHYFQAHGLPDPFRAYHQAEILLGNLVARQALIMAFSDAFYVMAVVMLAAAAAVVLTRSTRPAPALRPAHA